MRRIRTVQSTEMRCWNVPGSRSLVAVAVAVSDDETAAEAEAVGRGGRRMSHSLWIGKATTMTKTTAQGDEIAISVPSWGRKHLPTTDTMAERVQTSRFEHGQVYFNLSSFVIKKNPIMRGRFLWYTPREL